MSNELTDAVKLVLAIDAHPAHNPETIVLTPMSRKQLVEALDGRDEFAASNNDERGDRWAQTKVALAIGEAVFASVGLALRRDIPVGETIDLEGIIREAYHSADVAVEVRQDLRGQVDDSKLMGIDGLASDRYPYSA